MVAMDKNITFRPALPADIALLAGHHRQMFEEMRSLPTRENCCGPANNLSGFPLVSGQSPATPTPDYNKLEAIMREKLTRQMADGSCIAWLAESQNRPVASGGISIISTVPVPEDPTLTIAFLHSVFTEKPLRGQGIASTILDKLLNHCRKKGIKRVQLNASEAGRSVYLKKGFQPLDNVMICWL